MYKITVIIPTYNEESTLLTCFDSLLNQTIGFENIEIIIVDDNSTDTTQKMINDLTRKYKNVNSFFLKNTSEDPGVPRNIGIQNSSTDYVMFLDSDDIFYPEMCEVMHSTIKSNSVDICVCRYKELVESEIREFHSHFIDNFVNKTKIDSFNDPDLFMAYPFVWNKIFRKNFILEKNILFPHASNEDFHFSLETFLKSEGIYLLNNFYGYQYTAPTSKNKHMSNTLDQKKFKNLLKGFILILKLADKTDTPNLIDVKNFILTVLIIRLLSHDLDEKCMTQALSESKSYFKSYNIFARFKYTNIWLNYSVNIFIKLSSFSNSIPKVLYKLFHKIIQKKFDYINKKLLPGVYNKNN
ncbi:MAG: glycosyltransferase family 2 protein [Methanobrevibacter sp. CfCl-M3]